MPRGQQISSGTTEMAKVRDAYLHALVGGCLMFAGLAGAQAANDQALPDPFDEQDEDFARGQPPGDNYPGFEVDPGWPKPLPNNWLIGQVGGIAVDRHDNIWILQRARSLTSDEAGALGQFEDATNEEGVPISALGTPRPGRRRPGRRTRRKGRLSRSRSARSGMTGPTARSRTAASRRPRS